MRPTSARQTRRRSGPPRQIHDDVQARAARVRHRLHRHHRRLVVGIGLLLPAGGVDHLPEIAFLVQQADADRRHAEIARRLEDIARQHAKPARIQRQRLAEAELHAEIRHPGERVLAVGFREPARRPQIGAVFGGELVEMGDEAWIGGKLGKPGGRDVLEQEPGVMGARPQLGIDLLPQRIGAVAPGPAQIERQLAQRGERRGQPGIPAEKRRLVDRPRRGRHRVVHVRWPRSRQDGARPRGAGKAIA